MKKFNILVVDDDTTCLHLLKAHLENWNYEVTTVDDAHEALYMLKIRCYDLVISDVHMPGINGIELLKQIDEEFHLPVIRTVISADGNAEVMCMMEGAQRFLEKPIEANDLKEIWQIIVWWKAHKDKNTAVTTENNESSQGGVEDHLNGHDDNINADGNNINFENVLSSAAVSTGGDVTKGSRKKKLVWTTELHHRFAEALLVVGYENAVPSNILKFMKVSRITHDHVASHLQKYRMFLQQVLDGKTQIQCSKWIDLNYNSSIVPGNPDLFLLNQLSEKRRKGDLAVDNPLGMPKQHNIDTNVQFPNGSSSSGQYRPLPQFTRAEAYSSANVASRELGSATFPNGYNENIESSFPDMGEMGYYDDQNTLVQELNNYPEIGELFGGGINDMISSANILAPSGTAPLCNNFDTQQSIKVGGQGSSDVTYGNNISTDQFGNNNGDPSIGISFNANQFGNNSTTNAQCPQQPDGEQMTDGSWPFNNNGSSFNFN